MSLLTLVGIGIGLVILSLGIYLATRKLVVRSMYPPREAPRSQHIAEPLYEVPMPKPRVKPVKTSQEGIPAEKNPLLEFINQWEEPQAPKPRAKTKTKGKAKPKAKRKPKTAPKVIEAASEPEKRDNPLLRFIEEWEEPKPGRKKG